MLGIFRLSLLLLFADPEPLFSERNEFQLVGRVLDADGDPVREEGTAIFLQGAITPFSAQSQLEGGGVFKFRNLPAGTYVLIVEVPRAGEMRKTIEVGPSFADSRRRIAVTLTFDQKGTIDRERGVTAAELSIPDSAKREYVRAETALASHDIEGAIACLSRAVEIAPQFARAWNYLGTIAYQTQKYAQAEGYFREALKQDPEAYPPLVNLGGALGSQGKVKEALSVNQAAVRIKPNDPLAHAQLGISYFFLDRLDDAETHLRRSKALDPSHFSYPQITLIEIYARKNQLSNAVAEMEEFLKLHPDSDWAPKIRQLLTSTRARLSSPP